MFLIMFAEHFHATNYFKYLPDVTTQQSVAITISFAPSSTGSREDYIPSPPLKKTNNNNDKKNSSARIHSTVTITISFATKPAPVKRIVSPRAGDKNFGRAIFHGGRGITERGVWSTAVPKTLASASR